jgi:hypothetical protein
MSGTATLNAPDTQVALDSIVMGTVDGASFGEASDLVLTFNFNFFGSSNTVPTPEPSTALLLAIGLAGVAARRRHRSARRG